MAIVAPENLLYGISRIYQGYAYDLTWKESVFRTRKEADAWLESVLQIKGKAPQP